MRIPRIRIAISTITLLASALASPSAPASGKGDHERARQALEAGEILPLKTILQRVEREQPGQLLEVELERRNERWVYELKLLRGDGTIIKLYVNARDGTVESLRERGAGRSGER